MFARLSMAVAALTARSKRAPCVPSLWVFSDIHRLPDPSTLLPTMRSDVGVVIRHPDAKQSEHLLRKALSRRLSKRVKILVSQDWRVAAALRADGVHFPEADVMRMPVGLRLWRRAGQRLITTSAHSENSVRRARQVRPDLIFVSPVFTTPSHPQAKALGARLLTQICRNSFCAVGALGGVTQGTLRALQKTRVSAVAGISLAVMKY